MPTIDDLIVQEQDETPSDIDRLIAEESVVVERPKPVGDPVVNRQAVADSNLLDLTIGNALSGKQDIDKDKNPDLQESRRVGSAMLDNYLSTLTPSERNTKQGNEHLNSDLPEYPSSLQAMGLFTPGEKAVSPFVELDKVGLTKETFAIVPEMVKQGAKKSTGGIALSAGTGLSEDLSWRSRWDKLVKELDEVGGLDPTLAKVVAAPRIVIAGLGDWAADAIAQGLDIDSALVEGGQRYREESVRRLAEITPAEQTFAQEVLFSSVQTAAIGLPGIVATMAFKNPVPLLTAFGASTYGDSYIAGLEAGKSPSEAHEFAKRDAVIEIATEIGPAKVVLGANSSTIRKFVTRLFKSEMGGETLATIGQKVNSAMSGVDTMPIDQWFGSLLHDLAVTWATVGVVTPLQGATAKLAGTAIQKMSGPQDITGELQEITPAEQASINQKAARAGKVLKAAMFTTAGVAETDLDLSDEQIQRFIDQPELSDIAEADLDAIIGDEVNEQRLISELVDRVSGIEPVIEDEDIPASIGAIEDISEEFGTTPEEALQQFDAVVEEHKGKETWMKAPNGEPTKLNDRQWVQTQTPAFNNWFEGSSVVAKNGEPLIMFHGSPNQFEVFEKQKVGFASGHTASGLGHFFTTDKRLAHKYADQGAGTIFSVYLDAKNPYKLSLKEAQSFETVADSQARQKELIAEGYDSISFVVPGMGPQVIIFDSNQVKSATANIGTFDPVDPRIVASVGEIPGEVIEGAREVQRLQPFSPEQIESVPLREAVESGLISEDEGAVIDGFLESLPESLRENFDVVFSGQEFEPTEAQLKAHDIESAKGFAVRGALLERIKNEARDTIVMFSGSDVTTFFHEFGELAYKRLLTSDERKYVASLKSEAGAKVAPNEWFSDQLQSFVVQEKEEVFKPKLQKILTRVADTIRKIWERIRTTHRTPALDQIFRDILFGHRDINPSDIESPEFSRWFGESKVVDENGDPLVVYHGTAENFDAFDPGRSIGGQFWFTTDKKAIEAGEVGAQGRGVILDVYLSIKNPAGWKEYDNLLLDELISRGYDGLALPDKDGTVTYVAFDPTQIKSATENIGTFDPTDPDIRAAIGERPVKTMVREITGQVEVDEDVVRESVALKAAFTKAAQAARAAERAGNKEGVAKEKARMKAILESAKERTQAQELRTKALDQIKKELKATKVKKVAGKPRGKFTAEIQEIFNTLRADLKLTKVQAFNKIAQNLEDNKDNIPPYSVAIENRLLSVIAAQDAGIGRLGFARTQQQGLENILAEIKGLKGVGLSAREAQKAGSVAEINQAIEDVVDLVGGVPAGIESVDVEPGIKERIRNFIIAGPTNYIVGWKDLLDIISFKDKSSKPFQSAISKFGDVLEAKNTEKQGNLEAGEEFVDIAKESFELDDANQVRKKFNKDSVKINLGEFINLNGTRVKLKMSKAEMRKRVMEIMDPSLHGTIFTTEGMAWTQDMADAVFDALSVQDETFVVKQLEFYQRYYESINEVYKLIYGVNLPKNINYSPISREVYKPEDNTTLGEFFAEAATRASATTAGGIKARVRSTSKLRTQADVSVFMQHVAEMEHFKAWAEKIRSLNAVFGNPQVKKAIRANFGESVDGYIDRFIINMARGGKDTATSVKWLDKMMGWHARAVLAIKPNLTIKQLTSFVAYADAIPVTDFVTGLTINSLELEKRMNFLYENSTFVRDRWVKGSINRDLDIAARSDEYSRLNLNPSFMNSLLFNIKVGDMGAILYGGYPVYEYHYNRLKKEMSEPEAKKKAISIFESISDSTQQSPDIPEQSMMQQGGSFAKLFTRFKSSQNQYLRKEISAVRNRTAGRTTTAEMAKTLMIFHFVIPMFFQLVSDGFTWETDDDEDALLPFIPLEQKRAMILGSLNGYFIMGDMLDTWIRNILGLRNFSNEELWWDIFRDLKDALLLLDWDDIEDEDMVSGLRGLAGGAGGLSGTPLKTGYDIGTGVSDVLSGEYEEGWLKILGWSPHQAEMAAERSEE